MSESFEQVTSALHTVRDWIRWAASEFQRASLYFGHGTDNAWDEATQLVAWLILSPWQKLPQLLDARLTPHEKQQLYTLIQQRIEARMPLAYLTGVAYFAGLEFHVTPDTLIPRSPMAELIEKEFSPWLTDTPDYILDLCAGNGCIGLAAALAFPEAYVDLSDISEKALAVAQRNIAKYQLEARVSIILGDLFEGNDRCYDLILCNPPYVDEQDMQSLPPEYHVEPVLALASGFDGLDFTRRLLQQAANHLTDNGVLIVEVGNSAEALEALFPEVPFTWIEFERGGDGVFLITRTELLDYQALFNAQL